MYLTDIAPSLRDDQEHALCMCINSFGTSDHAYAEPDNVYFFSVQYAIECLTAYFTHGHRTWRRDNTVLDTLDAIKNAANKGVAK